MFILSFRPLIISGEKKCYLSYFTLPLKKDSAMAESKYINDVEDAGTIKGRVAQFFFRLFKEYENGLYQPKLERPSLGER